MSVSGVRTILHRRQVSLYYNRKEKFEEVLASLKEHCGTPPETFPTLDTWKSCFLQFIHALSSSFLADFWKKDEVYAQCMRNTTIDEKEPWLSQDHTFASTSKITL